MPGLGTALMLLSSRTTSTIPCGVKFRIEEEIISQRKKVKIMGRKDNVNDGKVEKSEQDDDDDDDKVEKKISEQDDSSPPRPPRDVENHSAQKSLAELGGTPP